MYGTIYHRFQKQHLSTRKNVYDVHPNLLLRALAPLRDLNIPFMGLVWMTNDQHVEKVLGLDVKSGEFFWLVSKCAFGGRKAS
jgi:hypothetical protein